ncbi:hypothetical protein K435DRAFT_801937 [Dendrothele bispora CBS 962.96]|uniref:Uncharacterized protein n=1 Tax=Dendrothele bispora (strain CBS 962.96) TaxID=1314807 RepID=A0A4S8LMM5_DENBC|nr:hypothetical protein K435DRAFT_801937 [Dendrothele bispora CBS 962.96]
MYILLLELKLMDLCERWGKGRDLLGVKPRVVWSLVMVCLSCLMSGLLCYNCNQGVKVKKGKEGKGKEGKGKEGKGREGKGRERKGKERKGKERKGKQSKAKQSKGKWVRNGGSHSREVFEIGLEKWFIGERREKVFKEWNRMG